MGESIKPALCGKCRVALEGVVNPEPHSVFSCPACGEKDTYENVVRIIGEYAHDEAARFLHKKAHDVARRSKFISVKSKPIPNRTHRFIVELDLR